MIVCIVYDPSNYTIIKYYKYNIIDYRYYYVVIFLDF